MTSKKYYMRFSNAQDLEQILDFYELNAHKNVRKRRTDLLQNLAENGAIIILEDDDKRIAATSITYPHTATDTSGIERVKWQEVGSTRIVLNGYPGLFDAMVGMQVLRAFLVEPPEDRFVAKMHSPAVLKMACRLGWRSLQAADSLVDSQFKTIDSDELAIPSKENWFHVGIEGLPVMARAMCEVLNKSHLEHPKTGEKIYLDLSKSEFFRIFESDIRQIAAKNYGDPDQPDYARSVAMHRQEWLRQKFK
jgi:hypothetical protein